MPTFRLVVFLPEKRKKPQYIVVFVELLTGFEPVTSSLPKKKSIFGKGNALPQKLLFLLQYLVFSISLLYIILQELNICNIQPSVSSANVCNFSVLDRFRQNRPIVSCKLT